MQTFCQNKDLASASNLYIHRRISFADLILLRGSIKAGIKETVFLSRRENNVDELVIGVGTFIIYVAMNRCEV